jgi:drug/metabolite transporter (DMT)-like permease
MKFNRYTLSGFLAILCWSSTVAFSRALSEALGPLTTGALIYTLGGLLGLAAASRQPGGLRLLLGMPKRYLLVCGGLFVTYMLLLYLAIGLAVSRAQVVAVGLANYLWPALIMLFSLPILHKRARFWLWPGLLLALGGTWLAAAGKDALRLVSLFRGGESLLPVALALGAAVAWGLYSNLAHKYAPKQGSAVPLFLLVSGLAFLGLRGLAGETSRWNWSLTPTLLYMSIFPAWLGYQLWDLAMQRGSLTLVTAASYFTPLLSTLVSILVLGLTPDPWLGLAALLVMGGAVLSQLGVVAADHPNEVCLSHEEAQ